MNEHKQACLCVASISLHAKAKHNGNAWQLVGMYVQTTFWVLYESSTNAQKWVLSAIMKPDDKSFFFLPVFSIATWIGLAGSVMPWKWCQYNLRLLLGSTKHYGSYINNGFLSFFFIWQLDFWLYFFF